MVKGKIGIEVIFNHIAEAGLTPNQFYLLHCMNQGITAPLINMHQELRVLCGAGWLLSHPDATGGFNYKPQPKALSLISKIDSYFGVQVKKSNNGLMGQDFETNAEKYNEIFPRMKLPSNKPARSPIKEIVLAFREFFKEYDYGWEIIHAAAAYYIEEEEKKGFKYTRTSRYFIRKQDSDKSWISDLAGYCELIKNGEDQDDVKYVDKVF
jgi:hypothetical protein